MPQTWTPQVFNDEQKLCANCAEMKPLDQFSPAPRTRSGLNSYCKPCQNAKQRECTERLDTPERRAERLERRWRSTVESHGITVDRYYELLDIQGGTCICGCPNPQPNGKRLAVDHDHQTGEVRGILCEWCNRALGYAKDRPEVLRMLADYLEGTE